MVAEESLRNLEVYERLRPEFPKHQGEYIAISKQKVVLFSRDFDEAFDTVKHDPYAIVCEVGDKPDITPVRIGWFQ